jgi:hypothetical protein
VRSARLAAPAEPHRTPDTAADRPCSVCLLPLCEGGAAGELSAAEASPLPFLMPCCAVAVHLACVQQCVSLRAIRKHCCACQQPFPDALSGAVEAAEREAEGRRRAARESFLARISKAGRLLKGAGGE